MRRFKRLEFSFQPLEIFRFSLEMGGTSVGTAGAKPEKKVYGQAKNKPSLEKSNRCGAKNKFVTIIYKL